MKFWTYLVLLVLIALCVQDFCDAWSRKALIHKKKKQQIAKAMRRIAAAALAKAKAKGKRSVDGKIPKAYLTDNMLQTYADIRKMDTADRPAACAKATICGGLCLKEKCRWQCDSICNVIIEDGLIWPGELVELPCNFDAYDGNNDGFISAKELSSMVGGNGDEQDNTEVFSKFDTDDDGTISPEEFASGKDHLLIDRATC